MGFARPTCHHAAGELLPHHFILTAQWVCTQREAVYFLLHFPSGRPAWSLASIVPFEVRTFLHPRYQGRADSDSLFDWIVPACERAYSYEILSGLSNPISMGFQLFGLIERKNFVIVIGDLRIFVGRHVTSGASAFSTTKAKD